MRRVEIVKTFNRNDSNFEAGKSYIMAEDIESQLRSVAPECFGMSYPIDSIYKKYNGEDLTNKKLIAWRHGGLGDMFFLAPVFKYLKYKYPSCHITMASGCKEPLENMPEIDVLCSVPFDAALLERSDFAIMFQGIIEGSSERSKTTHAVDMFYSYFNIDSTHIDPEFKKPQLTFTNKEMDWLNDEMSRLKVSPDDFVVGIQIESSSPVRNYPKEKLKVVVDILAREPKVKIFLIGGPQQAMLANFLKGSNGNVAAAVNYNVRQSIILVNRYNIVVSPDSFMIQMAGALDKPLVGIYGPFPSEVRMKYFKNAVGLDSKVVCSPCFKHDFRPCIKGFPSPCFSLIDPEDVLQAVDHLRNRFYGGHFGYIAPLLRQPDFTEIERYFLSADKGLCFFGAYFKHHNMLRVDTNNFVDADITDLNHPFQHNNYPFVLFMNNFGYRNGAVFSNCRNFVRPGGYFIVYRENCPEQMFEELKKDVAKGFTLMHLKFDPAARTGVIVGRKSF